MAFQHQITNKEATVYFCSNASNSDFHLIPCLNKIPKDTEELLSK